MRVGPGGSVDGETAWLRLRCPKSERSGPCHGRVRLLSRGSRRLLAKGKFRIQAGKGDTVVLKGNSTGKGPLVALARVKGADRLGNAAVVERKVHLRRNQKPHPSDR
jgi:hypothetical protein